MEQQPIYTLDYFIKKFEAIPEQNWCTDITTNVVYTYKTFPIFGQRPTRVEQHCALGHCGLGIAGLNHAPEAMALNKLADGIVRVNDSRVGRYQQKTPKQRVLAYLRDLKASREEINTDEAVKEAQEIISQPSKILEECVMI